MEHNLSFDEALALLTEDPVLFSEKVRSNPSLLDLKWVGSETLLHFLAVECKHSQVRYLASLGANVNTINDCGETPLHGAILSNDSKGVELLLMLGADPYITSKAGLNSLEWAEFLDVDESIINMLKGM